jgi:hypothetical protein
MAWTSLRHLSLELPRNQSGTGQTEIIINRQKDLKVGPSATRAPCQRNKGSVEVKQRPLKMGGRAIYRTLFQIGINRWFHLWMVPGKRWISHTHPMWLWGHSLFKISLRGPVLYGTKWLLWRPHKRSPICHSKCRIDKGLIKTGSTIDHWRSQCKGWIIMAHPLCIHSFNLLPSFP